MPRCLVTGGAGFIGSHLCDYLINQGYEVVCLDNLLTGSEKNLEALETNPNFKFLREDVVNPEKVLQEAGFDCIFHLASPASPVDYQNHAQETLLANSLGTLKMLELARTQRAKVLIASTSEIYGDPKEHPQKETYWGNVNSYGPRSCYDESKRFAEAATYVFWKKYDLDVRVIRIFNTYGPRMQKDDGRVISNFINQALEGKPLTVYGDGSQTRSFCYVADMAEGIVKALFSKNTKGEIFNLGNPEEYSIKSLAQKILELMGKRADIEYKKLPADDPQQRQPDITKAKQILSWEPRISVTEGLQKTIEYYRSL